MEKKRCCFFPDAISGRKFKHLGKKILPFFLIYKKKTGSNLVRFLNDSDFERKQPEKGQHRMDLATISTDIHD